jgi:hypothetical protein
MSDRFHDQVLWLLIWTSVWSTSGRLAPAEETLVPIDIGTRIEMFVDNHLIDTALSRNVALELQEPVRREVVLTTDKPWEGPESAYFSIFQDGPRFRLYYRGSSALKDDSEQQVTCYAESTDGINFVRPILGLHEINGSKENNVILTGVPSHNFAPFLDTNPAAKPEERYKALAGLESNLFAYCSADGLRWRKLRPDPVMTKGTFDSLNLAFWDESARSYRAYTRYFDKGSYKGYRAIQHSQSPDFVKWTDPQPNEYAENIPPAHFYTNATTICPGAPNYYLAFPMRFIPERTKITSHKERGVSDAVFMSSRDGQHWDRTFLSAWLRPGPDAGNWTERSNMPAWGIVQTRANEFSMYASEHYRWPDNRLRRVTIRRHGFASMHAGDAGGEFTTKPLKFSGKKLVLNYSTSAAGSVQVEIQDAKGVPIPGYAAADMDTIYGDQLDLPATWKSKSDLSALAGRAVRFRFILHDADLFAIRTE